MRVLHEWADHVCDSHAARTLGTGGHRRQGSPQRQYLSLWSVSQHHRSRAGRPSQRVREDRIMQPFELITVDTIQDAVKAQSSSPTARKVPLSVTSREAQILSTT